MQSLGRILILGGGLAGSLLAVRLQLAGAEVLLIDDRHPAAASRVAAGLFNVITGRFGAKTWMAETFLAEIDRLLREPQLPGLDRWVQHREIYRPCKDVEDYNRWSGRSEDPGFRHLIQFEEQPLYPDLIDNPFGGIRILPCGWVNIGGLIDDLQARLPQLGGHCLVGTMAYDQVSLSRRELYWEGERLPFDQVICCEGHRIRENPWFQRLPVQPNKGEILDIEAPDLADLPFVLSKKVYLVPGAEGQWVVGSTYDNHFSDPHPSEAGRATIEENLRKVLKVSYRVTGHRAGIRPTTPNRRPILGTHPLYPHLHVCTGFGTKGMLAAPYSSRLLVDRLCGLDREIPEEMRLDRFKAFRA